MSGGLVEYDRSPEADRHDREIGAVAWELFERDPYRELSAMLLTLRCADVIRRLVGREPSAAEVAHVAGRVARAGSPEAIAEELLGLWPDSIPPSACSFVSLITMGEFDNPLWRMFLLNPERTRSTAADVVHVAARVWPMERK